MISVFQVFIIFSNLVFSQPGNPLEIVYVANEGFLISSGNQKVIIDGIFKAEFNWCVTPSDEILAKISMSSPPFDDVDLVLFTHHHVDHFSAPHTIHHLKQNPDGITIATLQTLDLLQNETDLQSIVGQVRAITPQQGKIEKYSYNGIEITILGARHSPYYEDDGTNRHENVQQNGYLIHIGDKTLLHLGDASVGFMHDIIDNFKLDKASIDIMFYQCDGRPESIGYIQNVIKPKTIVAMHLHPSRFDIMEPYLKRDYPQAFFFRELMEKRTFN